MDDKGAASFPRFSVREQIQRFSIGTLLCFGIMINMELFQAKDHYILQSGDNALWCSRKDGSVAVRPGNACILTYNMYMCFSASMFPFSLSTLLPFLTHNGHDTLLQNRDK